MRTCCLLLVALLSGCAIDMPAVPLTEFTAGDIAGVYATVKQEEQTGPPENQALLLNIEGQCQMYLGHLDDAWRDFGAAGRIMGNWQTGGSETFNAVVFSESSKTYKGDPYEKAMNAFYLGLTYLWRGEPDNARAAFKKGILADAESGDEKYQADFTLLFWLAGRMSRLMGLQSDAEDFYKEARKANAFMVAHGSRGVSPNPVLENPGGGNLVVLVEVGMGPEKYAAGDDGELARFRPRYFPAVRAQVFLDGNFAGRTQVLVDVDYQARTRGGTEMEGIRKGKAVLKSVSTGAGLVLLGAAANDHGAGARDKAIIGGGLLLLGLLTSSAADIRHWPTLPSTVQALTADVAPGVHELRIEFLNATQQVLPELTQTWTVDVPEQGESYNLFRSLPGLDHIAKKPKP
jgi:hypothetical protein